MSSVSQSAVSRLGGTMADLIGVVGYLLVASAAVTLLAPGDPVRVLVVLPVLLFLPGYAVLAAVFPWRSGRGPAGSYTPDTVERIGLSFGVSVALAVLVGLVLSVEQLGFDAAVVLLGLSTVVVGGVLVAAVRRWSTSESMGVSLEGVGSALGLNEPTWTRRLLNLSVVLALTLAVVVVAATIAVPTAGESYTEFSLFTRTADGTLVTSDYPDTLVEGEAGSLVVGLENHERQPVTYTVVVALQRVETTDDGLRVVEQTELDRLQASLADGETWTQPHEVTPTTSGEDLRLVYLLYHGDAPATASVDTADDELHLWVTVVSDTA